MIISRLFILVLFAMLNLFISGCFADSLSNAYSFESYSISRNKPSEPNINFYLSKPSVQSYPIVILVGGSTDKEHLASILWFHNYFSKELSSAMLGAVSVEGWGINGHDISESEFMNHYTRTQILHDCQYVIDYIRKHPPIGWNGKLGLLGVSEGGNIAIELNEDLKNNVLATVLWSGASDLSWRDELWANMQEIHGTISNCDFQDCKDISSRKNYDLRMDEILENPSPNKYFFNMTNKYLADAMNYPTPNYKKMNGSLLIITGDKDKLVTSSDMFYDKAKSAKVDITYWRIESMDHYIRKRPDLIESSFEWLQQKLY